MRRLRTLVIDAHFGTLLLLAVATTLLLLPISATAGEPSTGVGGAKTFSAGPAEPKAVDKSDPKALLARCDTMLDQCETDQTGMPYLIAAYLVLWGILMVYFFLARRGQLKLQAELAELRLRLREYEDDQDAKDTGDKA